MGPVQTRPRAIRPWQPEHPGAVSAQRLEHLRDQIEQSILEAAGAADDELLHQIVTAAVGAFIDSRHDIRQASTSIADLLGQVGQAGAQQLVSNGEANDLATAFQSVHTATQKGLSLALGDLITRDELIRLREELVGHLVELHLHAHASLVRTRQLNGMTPQQRRGRLGATAFGLGRNDDIEKLAASEGIDTTQRVVAIVSISAAIPTQLRLHPQTIAGGSAREMLVPEGWNDGRLATQLAGQAVACPAVALADAAEAVTLARQAADLLRQGAVSDSRLIVPGADLLGDLVVGSNQLLAELIINKHLHDLEAMSAARRVTLGELTLGLLESGQPIDQVAKHLGIPRQTAHSRMKAIRTILGDALSDPTQRLELIVALRAALPQWRSQLAGESGA